MEIPNLVEIVNYSGILPKKELKPVDLNTNSHFLFENFHLSRQVKLLIEVTEPNSINSGNVFFNGEELFWISSPLKIVLFNPKKPSNVITYDIDCPVQIVFSYNLYLILTHADSFVTLLNFPKSFSQMFDNNDAEDYNFYIHAKNKKNILNTELYPKMLRPMPSSYIITSAQGNFIGCSDGVIRSFQVIGHWPDSNFLIKKAITDIIPSIGLKASPIVSLKVAGRFLYAFDASYNLSAYHIIDDYQISSVGSPINIPGKFVNMAPFCESVIITKCMGSSLIAAAILNQSRWYKVKKGGVIVSSPFESDRTINNYNPDANIKSIYLLNSNKKDINNRISVIWPTNSIRTSGNTVIIFLEYYYFKNEADYNEKSRKAIEFECKVKKGDIIAFAYNQFNPPMPSISMKDQFFPFEIIENQSKKVNFHYSGVDKKGKKTLISCRLKPIDICIHEFEDPDFQEDDIENSCLCIIGDYPICPTSDPSQGINTIESLFGLPEITHSIWGSNGSLFCIIYNTQPNFGNLLTMQFGINSVAKIQNITGRIFGYSTINKADIKQTTFKEIDKNACEFLFIFTSNGLLKISLNKEPSYLHQLEMNAIKHIFPFYMKKATINNLQSFQNMFENEIISMYPEKKENENKKANFIQTMNGIIRSALNCAGEDKFVSQLHLYNFFRNYTLIESDISAFVDNKSSEKIKPGRKRRRSKSNSFYREIRPLTPISLNEHENEKEIRSFYDQFRKCCENRDIIALTNLVEEAKTPNTKVQKLKVDNLSIWIAEEINLFIDYYDEDTLNYVNELSNIQEMLMEFSAEKNIFE